jgi:hypothetical protein
MFDTHPPILAALRARDEESLVTAIDEDYFAALRGRLASRSVRTNEAP